MKWKQKIVLILLLATGVATNTRAQDLNFSQYFNAPLIVNPANTGFNPDFDFRIGGNYRNKWGLSPSNPYRTMSVWADTKLFQDRFENGWLGLGGYLLKDAAGAGSLSATSGFATIAYHQMVGYNSLLSGGFGLGYTAKRIDISKLTSDNTWNGSFFDSNIPSNEPYANSQASFLDLQVGLNYAYFASDKVYFNAGVSIGHINTPRESFFDPSVSDGRIDRRYSAFVNASIKLQDVWIVNPNVYVSKMGGNWETVVGFNANRDLTGNGVSQLILGLYYRNKDAFIPMVGYQVSDLKFTINYDATVSSMAANGTRGAYELSIVKSGIFPSSAGRAVKCPTVKF